MFFVLFRSPNEVALTIVRIAVAVVIFPHGAQKMLGWFGGAGFEGTMHFFTVNMGIPPLFAFLAIVAEFFGSIAIFFGFLTRIAALGIASVMVVAVATTHLQHGFFMNWSGSQAGEGFEFHILVVGICLALIVKGAGWLSLDRWLAEHTGA